MEKNKKELMEMVCMGLAEGETDEENERAQKKKGDGFNKVAINGVV